VPVFGCLPTTQPRFRDGKPAESILQGEAGPGSRYKVVNARTSWDAGVIYGYGTDTNYDRRRLEHELKSLI